MCPWLSHAYSYVGNLFVNSAVIPFLMVIWPNFFCKIHMTNVLHFQVGTSLGATRGLLLRGGNILEKFAMVNTVVFDKTGTLTIGRPVVTKVVTSGSLTDPNSKLSVERNSLS